MATSINVFHFLDNGPLKVSLYDIHMLMNQNLLDGLK